VGILGKILSTPVRILNAPFRAIEIAIGQDSESGNDDNILSRPLESVAEALDEIDEN